MTGERLYFDHEFEGWHMELEMHYKKKEVVEQDTSTYSSIEDVFPAAAAAGNKTTSPTIEAGTSLYLWNHSFVPIYDEDINISICNILSKVHDGGTQIVELIPPQNEQCPYLYPKHESTPELVKKQKGILQDTENETKWTLQNDQENRGKEIGDDPGKDKFGGNGLQLHVRAEVDSPQDATREGGLPVKLDETMEKYEMLPSPHKESLLIFEDSTPTNMNMTLDMVVADNSAVQLLEREHKKQYHKVTVERQVPMPQPTCQDRQLIGEMMQQQQSKPNQTETIDCSSGNPESTLVSVLFDVSDKEVAIPVDIQGASAVGESSRPLAKQQVANKSSKACATSTRNSKSIRMWDDADRPTRARSAYNYFFKHERAKMLAARNKGSSSMVAKSNCKLDSPNNTRATERKQETTTEKVSFASMGREVGKKWRALDKETRATFQKMAKTDMERYETEKEAYLMRKRKREEELQGNNITP